MIKTIATVLALLACTTSISLAASDPYSGPYWMCPDAHGVDQQQLFRTIDITGFPMRIDALPAFTYEGVEAQVEASRTNAIGSTGGDPIEKAYGKLFGDLGAATMSNLETKSLAALCFATTAPPADQNSDGPFVFMPGYLVRDGESLDPKLDAVKIPSHLYLVLSYTGSANDIGNMRYSLTSVFWQKVAAIWGLKRDERAPNLMTWAPGEKGNEKVQHLEMWTPILPLSINQNSPWTGPAPGNGVTK